MDNPNQASLRAELTHDEGVRLKPYPDSRGKLTIGTGRNLKNTLTLIHPGQYGAAAREMLRDIPHHWLETAIDQGLAKEILLIRCGRAVRFSGAALSCRTCRARLNSIRCDIQVLYPINRISTGARLLIVFSELDKWTLCDATIKWSKLSKWLREASSY